MVLDGIISLTFFVIEASIVYLVLTKATDNPYQKLIASIIALLSLYQISEFLICSGIAKKPLTNKLGFVIITFLPPTGYLFASKIMNRGGIDITIIFGTAIGFAGYYVMTPNSIKLIDCNPFYAVYEFASSILYGVYYYSVILLAIGLLGYRVMTSKEKTSLLLQIGYLLFLIPMGLTIILDPTLMKATTSIMCKYAILLAITLGVMAFQPVE